VATPPTEQADSIAMLELPAILKEVNSLVKRFGGNKEALIRVIASI
jgi:hypothetical protein